MYMHVADACGSRVPAGLVARDFARILRVFTVLSQRAVLGTILHAETDGRFCFKVELGQNHDDRRR